MAVPQDIDFDRMRTLIREYLGRTGESARSLASRAHLSGGTVGHILSKRVRHPSSQTLVKIARAMDMTADELCGTAVDRLPETAALPDERRAASEFARANRVPAWAIRSVLEDDALTDAKMTAEDWYYAMRSRAAARRR